MISSNRSAGVRPASAEAASATSSAETCSCNAPAGLPRSSRSHAQFLLSWRANEGFTSFAAGFTRLPVGQVRRSGEVTTGGEAADCVGDALCWDDTGVSIGTSCRAGWRCRPKAGRRQGPDQFCAGCAELIHVGVTAGRLLNTGQIHHAGCCVGAAFPGRDADEEHSDKEEKDCDYY
jgi:hypothetical protein